jgi:hypothetical protein
MMSILPLASRQIVGAAIKKTGGLTSKFDKTIFDRWWTGTGMEYHLGKDEIDQLLKASGFEKGVNHSVNLESQKENSQYNKDKSLTRIEYEMKEKTQPRQFILIGHFYNFYDNKGKFVGFYDFTKFDPAERGERSSEAENQTRMVHIANKLTGGRAIGFPITYGENYPDYDAEEKIFE